MNHAFVSPSYLREWVLFTESAMLHGCVSTVAQNEQTKTLALERAFRFLWHLTTTVVCPVCLEREGVKKGYSAGCNLLPHR